ncbi:MAG: SMI1/KNR4 family protein [Deltaproteobacteria bacterium]|nr:SMI1/KNR4 family protein [Deltaproteobacteria bacterium]
MKVHDVPEGQGTLPPDEPEELLETPELAAVLPTVPVEPDPLELLESLVVPEALELELLATVPLELELVEAVPLELAVAEEPVEAVPLELELDEPPVDDPLDAPSPVEPLVDELEVSEDVPVEEEAEVELDVEVAVAVALEAGVDGDRQPTLAAKARTPSHLPKRTLILPPPDECDIRREFAGSRASREARNTRTSRAYDVRMSKRHRVLGTTPEALRRAEEKLGHRFPPSFSAWLLIHNGTLDVFPVLDERAPRTLTGNIIQERDALHSYVQNCLSHTPPDVAALLPVAAVGDGDWWCFDFSARRADAEAPIVRFSHETGDCEFVAESFEAFLEARDSGELD